MLGYIIRRLVYLVFLLIMLSMVSFAVIELPPGDYVDTLLMNMRTRGVELEGEEVMAIKIKYGVGLPLYQKYLKWMGDIVLHGDLGESFQYNRAVSSLMGERLALTASISLVTLVLTYAIAIPIGIYSATHMYSFGDFAASFLGYVSMSIPNFLLALLLMYLTYRYLGWSVGGLFTPEYAVAPWSFGKFVDLLKHLPIPLYVIGVGGTAGLIRVMRATLLDELKKQYVVTARVKGLSERRLLYKYPIRMAINPMVSNIGGILPEIISGDTLTSIVLSLPTMGPMLLEALQSQDIYLAASVIMCLGALSMTGTIISDIALTVVDPRIRFERLS